MIPSGTRVFFAVEPVDLRRSFDGLAATALQDLKIDPRHGGLFVFLNKRCNQVRVLFHDPHGWCILAKRLDRGRFRRPRFEDGRFCWEMDTKSMLRFLDDIDLSSMKRGRRAQTSPTLKLLQT